jgi:hypothetical protein
MRKHLLFSVKGYLAKEPGDLVEVWDQDGQVQVLRKAAAEVVDEGRLRVALPAGEGAGEHEDAKPPAVRAQRSGAGGRGRVRVWSRNGCPSLPSGAARSRRQQDDLVAERANARRLIRKFRMSSGLASCALARCIFVSGAACL